MTTIPKILEAVMSGKKDHTIPFSDLQRLLDYMRFAHRINGSHFIYWRENVEEIINIRADGNMAKAYQIKQVRNIIRKYGLD